MVGTVQCRPSSGSAEVAIKKKYSDACQNVKFIKWPETLGLFLKKLREQRGKSLSLRFKGKREYMNCIISLISQRIQGWPGS